jgi:type III secretory pathway component EscT
MMGELKIFAVAERPVVETEFWIGTCWGLIFSIPLWVLGVIGIVFIVHEYHQLVK